jgi:hypothetical protein
LTYAGAAVLCIGADRIHDGWLLGDGLPDAATGKLCVLQAFKDNPETGSPGRSTEVSLGRRQLNRDGRPLHLLAFIGIGLAVTLALVGVERWLVRPRPTELLSDPPENRPDQLPWMKCHYLEPALMDARGLRVVHPDGSAYCYVIDADVDPANLTDLPPSEGYADCWRGLLLCEADPPAHPPDGDRGCRTGDFHPFRDVELLDKVRPAAEMVHFGPHRGTP